MKIQIRKACSLLMSDKQGGFDKAMEILSNLINQDSEELKAYRETGSLPINSLPKKDSSFEFRKKKK